MLRNVTLAPGRTPPCVSDTTVSMVPVVSACANAPPAATTMPSTSNPTIRTHRSICCEAITLSLVVLRHGAVGIGAHTNTIRNGPEQKTLDLNHCHGRVSGNCKGGLSNGAGPEGPAYPTSAPGLKARPTQTR